MIRILYPLLFILFQISLNGQLIDDCFENQYIVQFSNQEDRTEINSRQFPLLDQRCLHNGSNLFLLSFDESRMAATDIKSLLSDNPQVVAFQKNCKASLRNGNTNDPLSIDQWSLERTGVTQLWEVTTGATTPNEDTIVVAILDSGFEIDQEDLINNVWRNKAEIDNDGIDNDNNGYIDDVFGLNLNSLDDDHETGAHGTAVAGIIGAKRDNELGIAGIAGDIQMILMSEAIFMDRVIAGLYYAYEQRKRYNESNGEMGAFVVATNYSLGFDLQHCAVFPLFDIAYDSLGSVGILSVGASPNRDLDIDKVGDIPSGCGSDFLISVTNTTEGDVKESEAGFGSTSIDMGAPGDNIITSFPANDYKIFGGTSGATPHVTGAIALLYSIPCEGFQQLIKSNPELAAREIKKALMEGVDPIPSLNNITVSAGRLNVWNAFVALAKTYGTVSDNFSLVPAYPNPTSGTIFLELELPRQGFYHTEIFSANGQMVGSFEIPGFCLDKAYEVNLNDLESGYYFLRIRDGDKMLLSPIIIL